MGGRETPTLRQRALRRLSSHPSRAANDRLTIGPRLWIASLATEAGGVLAMAFARGSEGLLMAGCALVVAGGGLRRRLLLAWFVVVGVLAVLLLEGIHRSGRWWVAVAIGLVVVLAAWGDVTVMPTAGRLRSALRVGALALGGVFAVGLTIELLAGASPSRASLRAALRMTVLRMLGADVQPVATGVTAHWMALGVPVAAALAGLGALVIALLPAPDVAEVDEAVRRRVAALCALPDSDSLAPFTRRRDKSYVFSADGRAVIGYRVVVGVCIAGPGPVGAPESWPDAMAAFVRRCNERGWRPAMIGASDDGRRLAQSLGLKGIHIGDEAVVSTVGYRLDLPAMRNVRQAVQRTRNAGVEVTVGHEGELSRKTREALGGVVDDWRRGAGELGFAMTLDGLLQNVYPDALVVVAHHGGRPVGFQRYVSCRGGSCLSLDVMPRLRHAPNGVNERLIIETIAWGVDHDVNRLSLNFAAFRTLFESPNSVTRRLLRWTVHRLDPFINVESLYRFNAKFRPQWVPRHVLYRSVFDLPFVIHAALRVEFGTDDARADQAAAAEVAMRAHS
ncbi:MAG: phosphatidylglycerol lysyltransferase domain-containing protein [Ilumatobacteraceae bacterium]